MKWKAASAIRMFAAVPQKVWPINTTLTENRPDACWNHHADVRAVAGPAAKLAHPQLEALLRWAAMLHEVGLNINHSGLHRHSAYILQHSDLPGFNQGSK